MEFCSCARGRQWCGIIHYYWCTSSIKPKLLCSRAGYVSWGLSLWSVFFYNGGQSNDKRMLIHHHYCPRLFNSANVWLFVHISQLWRPIIAKYVFVWRIIKRLLRLELFLYNDLRNLWIFYWTVYVHVRLPPIINIELMFLLYCLKKVLLRCALFLSNEHTYLLYFTVPPLRWGNRKLYCD